MGPQLWFLYNFALAIIHFLVYCFQFHQMSPKKTAPFNKFNYVLLRFVSKRKRTWVFLFSKKEKKSVWFFKFQLIFIATNSQLIYIYCHRFYSNGRYGQDQILLGSAFFCHAYAYGPDWKGYYLLITMAKMLRFTWLTQSPYIPGVNYLYSHNYYKQYFDNSNCLIILPFNIISLLVIQAQ